MVAHSLNVFSWLNLFPARCRFTDTDWMKLSMLLPFIRPLQSIAARGGRQAQTPKGRPAPFMVCVPTTLTIIKTWAYRGGAGRCRSGLWPMPAMPEATVSTSVYDNSHNRPARNTPCPVALPDRWACAAPALSGFAVKTPVIVRLITKYLSGRYSSLNTVHGSKPPIPISWL